MHRRISVSCMGEGCGHVTGVDYSPVSVERSRKFNAADVAAGRMTFDILVARTTIFISMSIGRQWQ